MIAVDAFGGYEPMVGTIRALRTFRIDADGILYPVHSDEPWSAGTNTARCLAADSETAPHPTPDWDCNCGFYAYGADIDTVEQPRAQQLLAAITVWGRVIAGTRGLRAEHARIEAVWVGEKVTPHLTGRLQARYPGTVVYRDRSAFLREHAPTPLDCYVDAPRRNAVASRGATALLGLIALAIGLVSARTITTHPTLLLTAVTAAAALTIRAAVLRRRPRDHRDRAGALFSAAAVLWLLSPFAGPAGLLLLRLPMLQLALLGGALRARLRVAATDIPAAIGSRSAPVAP